MKKLLIILSLFSLIYAQVPELHDTTIMYFNSLGDSLRYHEINYTGTTETFEVFPIGSIASIHVDTPYVTHPTIQIARKVTELLGWDNSYFSSIALHVDVGGDSSINIWNQDTVCEYFWGSNGLGVNNYYWAMRLKKYCRNDSYQSFNNLPYIILDLFNSLSVGQLNIRTRALNIKAGNQPKMNQYFLLNGRQVPHAQHLPGRAFPNNLIIRR